VGAGASVVEIAYTAFSFLAPAKVRFRYRLAGYDEWQDVGARRTAYYTRLPPGSYRFEVVAANNDGVWARAPAVATLIVAPFWWERRPPQVAALVLLLAAMALAVRSMSTRRARARLAALEQERALDRERSRIARDLHDDLGSRLSHIAIMAQSAGVPGRDARLFDAARDAVRTIDELVWAVNARNDTVESFAYYISQFAEEHVVAAGLRCRLALPPELPARPLTADVRRHLYLAFKEALTNAIRHARATEVRVSLAVEDSAVVVDVADNGAGIPDRVDPAGNGLGNMRERMQAARGTLEVETGPDRGTRIRFRAPLG